MNLERLCAYFLSGLMLQAPVWGAARDEEQEPLYRTEEVTVQAGDFSVVGDLYLPMKGNRHPAVVWVHGSGEMTRQLFAPLIKPQIEVFLKTGFAFFIDDIPGSGASKGQMKNVYEDRALILSKEIEALKNRPDIIPNRIGAAGVSQAGVVMPLATTMTSDIAFMIAEACVAEPAYKQDAYLVEQFMICEGLPAEDARKTARLHLRRLETEDYQEYVAAAEYLNNHEVCKLIGLDSPIYNEDQFKSRDKSPSNHNGYFDAMPLVAKMSCPILALFGEKDKNINPVQGFEAYRRAFKTAANRLNRVEMIADANHALYEAKTGCVRELMAQVEAGKPQYGPKVLGLLGEWLDSLKAQFDESH
jgi:uncharacterized protein